MISTSLYSDMLKRSGRPTDIHGNSYMTKISINRRWSILALAVAFLCSPANALAIGTSDQITENMLDNNCENLAWAGGTQGIGPQLNVMCSGPNGGNNGASIGGNAGTAQSFEATIKNRRRDRLEGQPTGRQISLNLLGGFSLYASGNFTALDRKQTTFSNRSDSTILGATMGADFRVNDRILTGVAFNYLNRPREFDNSNEFGTDAYGLLSYVSIIPIPATFLDISLGYSQYDYVSERSTFFIEESIGQANLGTGTNQMSDSAGRETDVHEMYFRVASGYDHNFVSSIGSGEIGPRFALNYSQLAIAPYTGSDQNGLGFTSDKQSIRSIQSTIGVQGSMRINTSYGIWVPQVTADYVHQLASDQQNKSLEFVEDQRRTSTKFSIGNVFVLPHGIFPFLNFRLATGDSQSNNYAGTIGVRIQGS